MNMRAELRRLRSAVPALAVSFLAGVVPMEPARGQEDSTTEVKDRILFDFTAAAEADSFRPINDGVMGGLSESGMRATADSTAVFAGTLSLENNGGFASVRSGPRSWDLAGTRAVRFRVRGDGRTYQFRIRTDARFDGVTYAAEFITSDDEWIEVELPFTRFAATLRGRAVPDAPPLDPAGIQQMGFLLADRRPGPFRLEVDWIKAVG